MLKTGESSVQEYVAWLYLALNSAFIAPSASTHPEHERHRVSVVKVYNVMPEEFRESPPARTSSLRLVSNESLTWI